MTYCRYPRPSRSSYLNTHLDDIDSDVGEEPPGDRIVEINDGADEDQSSEDESKDGNDSQVPTSSSPRTCVIQQNARSGQPNNMQMYDRYLNIHGVNLWSLSLH